MIGFVVKVCCENGSFIGYLAKGMRLNSSILVVSKSVDSIKLFESRADANLFITNSCPYRYRYEILDWGVDNG